MSSLTATADQLQTRLDKTLDAGENTLRLTIVDIEAFEQCGNPELVQCFNDAVSEYLKTVDRAEKRKPLPPSGGADFPVLLPTKPRDFRRWVWMLPYFTEPRPPSEDKRNLFRKLPFIRGIEDRLSHHTLEVGVGERQRCWLGIVLRADSLVPQMDWEGNWVSGLLPGETAYRDFMRQAGAILRREGIQAEKNPVKAWLSFLVSFVVQHPEAKSTDIRHDAGTNGRNFISQHFRTVDDLYHLSSLAIKALARCQHEVGAIEGGTCTRPNVTDAGDDNANSERDTFDGQSTSGDVESTLTPKLVQVKAVYEWASSAIPEADTMTIAELFNAIQNHPEMNSDFLARIPDNPDTFGKYLKRAGIHRYNSKGSRTRRPSRRHRTV